eukprot:1195800-Prorocentrum_minimum.AAC.7
MWRTWSSDYLSYLRPGGRGGIKSHFGCFYTPHLTTCRTGRLIYSRGNTRPLCCRAGSSHPHRTYVSSRGEDTRRS